jgi:hypothetical protein
MIANAKSNAVIAAKVNTYLNAIQPCILSIFESEKKGQASFLNQLTLRPRKTCLSSFLPSSE